MTDLGGGVFQSRADTDAFEADDEVGGFTHMLFEDGAAMAGMWQPEPGKSDYLLDALTARETIIVLAGAARIEVEDGPTLELKTGDMASLPTGAVTSWQVSPDFKEFWVYS